ncbi:hypothetical protein ACWCWQ_35550 [Streptomyces sp. NPDC001571]
MRVHTGIGRDTGRDVCQDRRAYVWNSTGDAATPRDNHQHIVAVKSWGRRRPGRRPVITARRVEQAGTRVGAGLRPFRAEPALRWSVERWVPAGVLA